MSTNNQQPYTTDDLVRDVNSPQYRNDPKFRAEVERKVAGMNAPGRHFKSAGNDYGVDYGRGGSVGGFSVLDGMEEHRAIQEGRQSNVHYTRAAIDETAVYVDAEGAGFNSAFDIIQTVNSPEYRANPAFRERVARAYEAMGAPLQRKV